MICNNEHVRQSDCEMGNAVSTDEVMNEGKPSHAGRENLRFFTDYRDKRP